LAAWWGQEARPRWGNHAPPAGRRMGHPLEEARSRAPQLGFQSRPARSFRKMCPSRDYMPERAPPSSMVSASSLTQTRIASCGPTSRFNPGPTLWHGYHARDAAGRNRVRADLDPTSHETGGRIQLQEERRPREGADDGADSVAGPTAGRLRFQQVGRSATENL
jgi:hypothetical protein